jgi:hypothetical protein
MTAAFFTSSPAPAMRAVVENTVVADALLAGMRVMLS